VLVVACGDKNPSVAVGGAVKEHETNGQESDAAVKDEATIKEESDAEEMTIEERSSREEPPAPAEEVSPTKPLEAADEQEQEAILQSDADEEESAVTYIFPETLELGFQSVEPKALELLSPEASWEKLNALSIGFFDGDQVTLELYQATDADDRCTYAHEAIGILVYQGQAYGLPDCVPSALSRDVTAVSNEIIWLGHEYRSGSHEVYLHGTVALAANGPGRIGILYYDRRQGSWWMLDDWGKPILADLDGDRVHELGVQFEGLHLHSPDVTIYRWNQGSWERSRSVNHLFDVPEQVYHQTRLVPYEARFVIEFEVMPDPVREVLVSARYTYQSDALFKLGD
jgi:hypothetical protein